MNFALFTKNNPPLVWPPIWMPVVSFNDWKWKVQHQIFLPTLGGFISQYEASAPFLKPVSILRSYTWSLNVHIVVIVDFIIQKVIYGRSLFSRSNYNREHIRTDRNSANTPLLQQHLLHQHNIYYINEYRVSCHTTSKQVFLFLSEGGWTNLHINLILLQWHFRGDYNILQLQSWRGIHMVTFPPFYRVLISFLRKGTSIASTNCFLNR